MTTTFGDILSVEPNRYGCRPAHQSQGGKEGYR
jgi:hypothetical protein